MKLKKIVLTLFSLVFLLNFSISATVKRFNDMNTLSVKENQEDSIKSKNINKLGKTFKKLYNKLIKQVIDGEGKIGKIALAFNTDDDRYMVATEDIKAEETLLKIPESMLISPEHKLVSEFCNTIKQFTSTHKLEHDYRELCLQLWIGKERKNINKSKFQTFVAFLPQKLENFPILYKEKEMKMIKNTFLEELIQAERKYLVEDYTLFKEKDKDVIGSMTQEEFNQSYELFYSRTYQYLNTQDNSTTAFVPLVDLFNYKTGLTNKVGWRYNKDTRHFVVYAIDDIKKDDKVSIDMTLKLYIEYGNHSNYQYLTFYGFTLDKNPIRPSYNIYVGKGDKQAIVDLDGEINMIKVLNPIRLKHSLKKNEETEPKIISVSNEIQSLTALKNELDERVANYESTIIQDSNRLKNSIKENETNILRVIIEEKKVNSNFYNV